MKEKPSTSVLSYSLSFNPWTFFVVFLIANSLLSFYPCSLQAQLFIIFFGLILPFVVGYKIVTDRTTSAPNPKLKNEDTFQLRPWLWILLIFLVLFTRFYRLTTLPNWLYVDEGYESALALGLLNHWDWRLLWSPVPHEPLFDWLLGFYFKLFSSSLFTFRFFSTLISLATIGAAYWGSHPFVNRRASFLFAVLLAFCYWSFTLSRLGIVVILIPLIQCFAFGCLGRLIQARSKSVQWWSWVGLTFANILGFYAWINWVGLGLALSFILLIYQYRNPAFPKIYAWGFYVVSACAVFPLVFARLMPGGMAHFNEIYHFNPLKALIYNVIGIFWDGSANFNYGSLLGGFLNPIIDSLALLGALFFFQKKIIFWNWAFPLVVLISFLPALSAPDDIELYRTLPVMVFLTLGAATGTHILLQCTPQKLSLLLTTLVLLTSNGLDLYNYLFFYSSNLHKPENLQWRSSAYAQAYQISDQLNQKSGPLYVFSQFTTDYDDRTIDVALYPFNVLQNQTLSQAHPSWVVILTSKNYIPYFLKTYPHTQITLLKKNGNASDTFIALLTLPTSDISSNTLSQWKEADSVFRKTSLNLLNKNPATPWDDIVNSIPPLPHHNDPDPLVTAIYWEKIGMFDIKGKNYQNAVKDYEKAIQSGYPAAHLYFDLSLALQSIGEVQRAQQAFKKAFSIQ